MRINYFRFEEKLIKLALIPPSEGREARIMVLNDKSLEVVDLNYLTISCEADISFYREAYLKYRVGYPEVSHMCQAKNESRGLILVGTRDKFCF